MGDDSLITFLSRRSGENLLYRMRPDGSELAPIFGGELDDVPGLAAGQRLYRQPHWTRQSPDRSFFLSWARDLLIPPPEKCARTGRFMIYLGQTKGGPVRLLAPDAHEA